MNGVGCVAPVMEKRNTCSILVMKYKGKIIIDEKLMDLVGSGHSPKVTEFANRNPNLYFTHVSFLRN
jgi:hypothetical protein